MRTVCHNNETCIFNEANHTYQLGDGVILPSVTTYSKKYFKEFDSEKVAAAYALKNDLVKEDVLNMWKEKGDKASAFGTARHKFAEENIIAFAAKKTVPVPDNSCEKGILEKIVEIINTYDIIGQELILFSRQLNLAGTTDLLLGIGDTLVISDWKTNKEIKSKNPYQNALGCMYTYPDCEKTKYTVQLNLYLKLIMRENYFPKYTNYELVLYHVTDNGVYDIRLPILPRYIFDKL